MAEKKVVRKRRERKNIEKVLLTSAQHSITL